MKGLFPNSRQFVKFVSKENLAAHVKCQAMLFFARGLTGLS